MTMETTTQAGFSPSTFETLLDTRQEPEWSLELRRQAWDTFCELSWPSRSEELWARTELRAFRLDRYPSPWKRSRVNHSRPSPC